ncbi:MAG: TIGR03619 family F420-dependent LLM class oxidoreductase, partial [Chloroflexi bacterium]|nr:TIGR03619 family F420-dependent LLM class oxidoreductase [Chloroflexota bacterium]
DRILGDSPILEPFGLLGFMAALTKNIKLGTSMIMASTRNPVHLAKQFSSLDQMSRGRLIIGIGLGGRPQQYPLLDGPPQDGSVKGGRARHFRESVAVMKALWTQPKAEFSGSFWQLDGEAMEPKPFQKPHPPIWFGGRHPQGLRRAARLADGWMGAGSTDTAQFREHVASIQENLDAQGRDPADFPISKRVYIALDDDHSRAEKRIRDWFGRRYGDADLGSRVAVWGNADTCAQGLAEIIEAGAQMLMLNPMFDHLDHLKALPELVAQASADGH